MWPQHQGSFALDRTAIVSTACPCACVGALECSLLPVPACTLQPRHFLLFRDELTVVYAQRDQETIDLWKALHGKRHNLLTCDDS